MLPTMNGHHHVGPPPRDERVERALLLAVLEPPDYGGPTAEFARELGEPMAKVWAAAWWLETNGLVYVGNGHIIASGPAIALDALCPIAI
jgi:hypothetical protein